MNRRKGIFDQVLYAVHLPSLWCASSAQYDLDTWMVCFASFWETFACGGRAQPTIKQKAYTKISGDVYGHEWSLHSNT